MGQVCFCDKSKVFDDPHCSSMDQDFSMAETPNVADGRGSRKILAGRGNRPRYTLPHGAGIAGELLGEIESDEDDEDAESKPRSNSLPNLMKPGHLLSYLQSKEVKPKQGAKSEALQKRRGSKSRNVAVSTDDMRATWREEALCHISRRRNYGFELQDMVPHKSIPGLLSEKGYKGVGDKTPNQDNFSLTYVKNGWLVACVMDGHGAMGHKVSERVVDTVPYYLINSLHYPRNMRAALIEAFRKADADLGMHFAESRLDLRASGSTAVVIVYRGSKLWCAHIGDSPLLVGSSSDPSMEPIFQTRDHKPDDPEERKRIEANGGIVECNDGKQRILIPGKDMGDDNPGLNVARAFGDTSLKGHGVITDPEISEIDVKMSSDPFMLLSSDGVSEYLDSKAIISDIKVGMKNTGNTSSVLKDLYKKSAVKWKENNGEYRDDITALLIPLGTKHGRVRADTAT